MQRRRKDHENMTSKVKFSKYCVKCGLCCKCLDTIKGSIFSSIINKLDSGDGSCIYLKGNLCSIYDSRPVVCNAESLYKTHLSSIISKNEFFDYVIEKCEEIRGVRK